MGKTTLHLYQFANHEISLSQENSFFIVENYSLITLTATTEKFTSFSEAFDRWNEVCTEFLENFWNKILKEENL